MISTDIITTFLTILFLFALIKLYFHFTYWSRHGIPGPSFTLSLHTGVRHEVLMNEMQTYGRIYGTYLGFTRILSLNDPDLLRDILVKDFHIFHDCKHIHAGRSLFDKGLLFAAGDVWNRVRTTISPAFTASKLKNMLTTIEDICDQFMNSLKINEVINLHKNVDAYAMDVLCSCIFGIRVNAMNNPDHPLITNVYRLFRTNIPKSTSVCILWPRLAKLLKLEPVDLSVITYINNLVETILTERKGMISTDDLAKDFIQLMIDSCDESNSALNEDIDKKSRNRLNDRNAIRLTTAEITAQGLAFFMAGFDSTAAAILHAVYYLSLNSECQQRLYEELTQITEYSYETLNGLKYLNAVIDETLRLKPSVVQTTRLCADDYTLRGTDITIQKGTVVQFSPCCINNDPDSWSEPDTFKPERFIEPQHQPWVYLPFSDGPRNCIAQRFALNVIRMCIAKMFRSIQFRLAPGAHLEYYKGLPVLSLKQLLVICEARVQ